MAWDLIVVTPPMRGHPRIVVPLGGAETSPEPKVLLWDLTCRRRSCRSPAMSENRSSVGRCTCRIGLQFDTPLSLKPAEEAALAALCRNRRP